MARLDRLAAAKEVAQVGAAIGRVFDTDLLAEVLGYPRGPLLDALGRLLKAGLIAPADGGESYAFKHALVRDAAHDSLLLRRRRELHGRIVDALEPRGTAPEVLATHCTEAGRTEAALGHWLRAGESSLALRPLSRPFGSSRRGCASRPRCLRDRNATPGSCACSYPWERRVRPHTATARPKCAGPMTGRASCATRSPTRRSWSRCCAACTSTT